LRSYINYTFRRTNFASMREKRDIYRILVGKA
jgi:hypothetical protein